MAQVPNDSIDDITKQSIAQNLWMKAYNEADIPADILAKIKSDKNSNASFANRFKLHLDELNSVRPSFVTSRAANYSVMAQYATSRSPQQCYANMLFMGPESVVGYEPISYTPAINFPAIDSPQWKYQVGWHFFVGNFTDQQNNHYSVQLMFWQYAQLPPTLAATLGLSDIENQTLEMHLAISDQTAGIHYRATTNVVAGTTGLVSFNANPYTYMVGKNGIQSLDGSANLFPARLTGKSWDMGMTPNAEIEIDLCLENPKGYFMEGDGGCSPAVDGVGTLYYSAALLKLMSGKDSSIWINGKKIQLTGGSMWYDHQWGTGFMPSGGPQHAVMRASQNLSAPAPGGWDWFMMQFHPNDALSKDGEVQITLSALHTAANAGFYYQTGPTPPGTMTATFSGKYIDAKNNTSPISGQMQVTEWVKSTTSPNPALYPPTNTWYPAKYTFAVTGTIPDALKSLTVTPIIASGQTGFFGNGLQYSEGGAVITDSNGQEIGRGFAEATNYADSNAGIVALAGLPVNQQTIGFMKAPAPSAWMKLLSFIYVIIKGKELKEILAKARGL